VASLFFLWFTMEKKIDLKIRKTELPLFFPLFQEGVFLKVLTGGNVRDLLLQNLDLSDAYVEKRIQTIFLNGKAVDDLETAIVRDGSVLALSAAMPGLAGATLRRGGTLASFRQSITLTSDKGSSFRKEGIVKLKLFNLLVSELGPRLLSGGVWVKAEEVIGQIRTLENAGGLRDREIGDSLKETINGLGEEDLIFLSVAAE
jgi:hypothetical protein